mmetsp:Transcript_22201/g.39556  ORF Transcript_22201/g.39556 Transcript_22201/m.39556 type:complete len:146 (+) Transcript_22201:545-982(+)
MERSAVLKCAPISGARTASRTATSAFCILRMLKSALMKDAPTKPKRKAPASYTEWSAKLAAMKDAPASASMEKYASNMVPSFRNRAALRDAQTVSSRVTFVGNVCTQHGLNSKQNCSHEGLGKCQIAKKLYSEWSTDIVSLSALW